MTYICAEGVDNGVILQALIGKMPGKMLSLHFPTREGWGRGSYCAMLTTGTDNMRFIYVNVSDVG